MPVTLATVCFHLKSGNTENLFQNINSRKKIHLTRTTGENQAIIRFVVCSEMTEENDIEVAVHEIKEVADALIK